MENAAEALKIAFAIMVFGIALTLSISSFSDATRAVDSITTMRDRERELQYAHVTPANDLSRIVGIETVVSSMYRAYEENIEIYFYNLSGSYPIYNIDTVDNYGNPIQVGTNCLDLAHKNLAFANKEDAIEFINILLAGENISNWSKVKDKYKNILIDGETDKGFYSKYKDKKFKEELGEYEQGSNASKITKRVIKYTLQD